MKKIKFYGVMRAISFEKALKLKMAENMPTRFIPLFTNKRKAEQFSKALYGKVEIVSFIYGGEIDKAGC